MKELIFHRLLVPAVERHASDCAYIDAGTGGRTTFEAHLERVARLTSGLRAELGLARGDRMAVLAGNGLPYIELWHAALLGGAVINPLNLRFSDEELAFVLADSASRVCFVDATFAETIDRVRKRAGIETVVLCGDGDVPHDLTLDDVVGTGVADVPPEPEEDDPVVLMYTGGTTGLPKGVLLEQRAEVLNQYHCAMVVPWVREWPFLVQTPLFHGASMLAIMGAPAFGVQSVILPAFDPVASMDAVERYGIGSTVMVPTMINMVLSHPDFDPARLASLRRLLYGASPMPTALLGRLAAALPDLELVQGYGMTEGSTLVTLLTGADHRRGGELLTSAGRALPGVELSIRDEANAPVGVGQVGEVCVRGGNFLREYWNRPQETGAALAGGWYHSGDVGYLDDAGYLFLVDRAKDMIVTGGENVYCVEVENAIASHPGVAQVAVIGIPDDTWGEAVHAVVVPRPGASPTAEEIIAHAREAVAGYKVPKSVGFRAEPLPLSAVMKVLKRELRAPFWEGRGRAIN
ncbi:MAG TPA: AMP-binding protein [Acidimicrobiia bacterium]